VHLAVDGEGGAVDGTVAFHHLALVVDQDQVRRADVPEVHAERVDPEVVGPLRIAGGDVPGDPFVEAELGEEAEGGGQALLPVEALVGGVLERHVGRQLHDVGHGVLLGGHAGRVDAPYGRRPVRRRSYAPAPERGVPPRRVDRDPTRCTALRASLTHDHEECQS